MRTLIRSVLLTDTAITAPLNTSYATLRIMPYGRDTGKGYS